MPNLSDSEKRYKGARIRMIRDSVSAGRTVAKKARRIISSTPKCRLSLRRASDAQLFNPGLHCAIFRGRKFVPDNEIAFNAGSHTESIKLAYRDF